MRCINLTAQALFDNVGDIPAMVDMRMRKDKRVYFMRIKMESRINFIEFVTMALEQPGIQEHL